MMKQKFTFLVILSPLIFAVIFLLLSARPGETSYDNRITTTGEIDPQKLIFLLQYIGIDYGGAVENGNVVNQFEYSEMLDFSNSALQWYDQLSTESETSSRQKLEQLKNLVEDKDDWEVIKKISTELIHDLSMELNVIPFPLNTPDLQAGENFYNQACIDCHGVSGDGRGPAAAWLNPPPSNLKDRVRMNEVTPYQLFNAITFGVEGTSMPSHQQAFTTQERWDLAFYLMTLRDGFEPLPPERDLKLTVNELAVTSNQNLMAQLRTRNHSTENDSSLQKTLDYFRQNPPGIRPEEQVAYTQQKLSESFLAYKNHDRDGALKAITEAYLSGIEPLEPLLLQKRSSLVTAIEGDFSQLRSAIRSQRPLSEVIEHYENLNRNLNETRSALESSTAQKGFVLLQSLTIILREGIEATLLIALMITYLISAGYTTLRKYVVGGALAGLAAGGLTWVASKYVLTVSVFGQEVMEGITSLLAAAVLFSVSFWIIHKVDIQKWKSFIRTKAEKALGTGSGVALAAAAFLAVFREAFETVLFYHVLWMRDGAEQTSIILGFVAGAAALAVLLVLIFKVGIRLPLKLFFTCTGILLGLLAFVFAGYGVRELQNIGLLKETLLPIHFQWRLLEIHPTAEGVSLQLGILTSFLLGWFSILAEKFKVERKIQLRAVAVKAE